MTPSDKRAGALIVDGLDGDERPLSRSAHPLARSLFIDTWHQTIVSGNPAEVSAVLLAVHGLNPVDAMGRAHDGLSFIDYAWTACCPSCFRNPAGDVVAGRVVLTFGEVCASCVDRPPDGVDLEIVP